MARAEVEGAEARGGVEAYLARLRVRDIPVALHARRPAAAEGVLDAANLRPSKRRGGCFAKGVYVLLLFFFSSYYCSFYTFGTCYDYEPGHRRDRESGIF